jgi:hypothetical protein
MDDICWDLNDIDFSKIQFKNLKPLQGGTYFATLHYNNNPILIQTPKCLTKNGIHKTGKKIYTDLKFSLDQTQLKTWLKGLEKKTIELIYEKSDIWFHDEINLDEIEYLWNSSIRDTKDSFLLRTFVQRFKNTEKVQLWNEDNEEIQLDQITEKHSLISIIEIGGLKFTSQSFQLEIYLRQAIVLEDKPIFSKCLIKLTGSKKHSDGIDGELETDNLIVDNEHLLNESTDLEVKNDSKEKTVADLEDTLVEMKKENDDLEKEGDKLLMENQESSEKNNELLSIDTSMVDTTYDDKNGASNEPDNVEENVHIDKKDILSRETDLNISQAETNDITEKGDSLEKTMNLSEEIKKEVNQNISETISDNEGKHLEDSMDALQEYDLKIPEDDKTMKLKTPRDVYLEIYKKARKKARDAKKEALKAFLEAKKIKETYLLDEYYSESSEDDIFESSDGEM